MQDYNVQHARLPIIKRGSTRSNTTFFFFFIRLSETIMLYLYDSRNNRYFEEKVNKQYEDRNDIPTKNSTTPHRF